MPDLLTCRSHRTSVSSLRTTFNKSYLCPWAAGVTLLSLQGRAPHAWGQDGGSDLGSFSCVLAGWCSRLCCSSVMWSRAAPICLWSCAQVRSQAQYLRVSCRIWDQLYVLCVPKFCWMKMQYALSLCRNSAGRWLEPVGQRGPELQFTLFPQESPGTWGHGSSDTASVPCSLRR